MKEITLNEWEESIVRMLAEKRTQTNRSNGVVDRKIGDQDAARAEMDGLGAEMAVAKLFNLYMDISVGPQAGGHDLISRDGRTIDVKHTHRENGNLLVPLHKESKECDLYVLVTGTMPNYRVVGWEHGKDILEKRNIKDLGYGPTYFLEQHRLHRFTTKKGL